MKLYISICCAAAICLLMTGKKGCFNLLSYVGKAWFGLSKCKAQVWFFSVLTGFFGKMQVR
jgi:hypothetical protein